MQLIKEISSISTYTPNSGDLLHLFRIALEKDISRKEANIKFKNGRKTDNHFYVTLNSLKSKLIDGIFLNSFNDYSKYNQTQFRLFKNVTAGKILFRSGKRKSGIAVATKNIKIAEKYGFISEALDLSRELETVYSVNVYEKRKFEYYKNRVNQLRELLNEEIRVQSLLNELNFCYLTKSDISHLESEICELRQYTKNKEYRYNLFRFSALHMYEYLNDNVIQEIKICREALSFFDSQFSGQPLPFLTKYHFQIQLVRNYLTNKDFVRAERSIRECVKLPAVGSYNWHQALFYLAILGFHSDKPKIAYDAWYLANTTPRKFDSPIITERWKIIRAYLAWYAKIGKLEISENFRLGKFMNEVIKSSQDKKGLNVSIIIVEMLHLLSKGDKKRFMEKSDRIDSYIRDNLKSKHDKRNRAFLKMLSKVDKSNYYKVRLSYMVKRWVKELKHNPPEISVNMIDSEVVPFDMIWDEVNKKLK